MTQRETTETQPVPRCAKGHHARHMVDLRRQSAGGGHFIECRCSQTQKHGSYADALREWGQKHGIRALKVRKAQCHGQITLFAAAPATPVATSAQEAA